MAARESIGHVLFHQAPPHDIPPLPTRAVSEISTPNSYAEACADEYSALWRQATEKKYHGLASAGTFGEMWQPDGLNVISAKWVFAWKPNEHVYVVRAKARQVARGSKQREGIDFFQAFAPTPAASCFRLLGAIACELGLGLCHFDAEQAFVLSSLEEDVYLRPPPGCGEMSGIIVRLNRSLRLETSVEVVA